MKSGKYLILARRTCTMFAGCLAFACPQAMAAERLAFPSGTVVMFPPVEQAAGFAEEAAGMTVYVDPRTGDILTAPAPGSLPLQVTVQERNALSTSQQGLRQQPSSVAGGGVMIDLQGRFQSPMVGMLDTDGNATATHIEPPADGNLN